MKTLKLTLLIALVSFCASSFRVNAQTERYVLDFGEFTGWVLSCSGEEGAPSISLSGHIVYQLTVHRDPVTGKVTRMHNNVLHAELYNSDSGEKYRYIDTGSLDNLGTWWPEWLGVFPEQPAEGSTVAGAGLKIVGKGGVIYRIKIVTQVHFNANGDPVVDFQKGWIECNI